MLREKNKLKNILENFTTKATDVVKHDVFSLAITFMYLLGIFDLEEISTKDFSSEHPIYE